MPFARVTTVVERGESAVCARIWAWQGVFGAAGRIGSYPICVDDLLMAQFPPLLRHQVPALTAIALKALLSSSLVPIAGDTDFDS